RYRTTHTKFLAVTEEIFHFKVEQSIETRWTPSSKEYNDALILVGEHKYRKALSELKRLVVQWLFELTKMNMSGINYKLRDQISKALQTHAAAIHRALQVYNEATGTLNPPRECLTWADILKKTTIAEFDLLRDMQQDIRTLAWTQPPGVRRQCSILGSNMGKRR
ncbi:hypothetical protein B0H10DRAFT_1784947, partial [Mycena sp. CBHHK59/15]